MAYVVSLLPENTARGEEPSEEGRSELEKLLEVLERNGAVEEKRPGRMVWSYGHARLEIEPVLDGGGRLREAFVELPFGAVAEEIGEAMKSLIEAAEANRFRAFDPQLGRSVTKADVPSITSRFQESSSYHVQYSGLSEDARQGLESASSHLPPALVSPKGKALLVFIGVFLALYIIFRVVVIDGLLDALNPADGAGMERPPGPPPGWLDRHPPSG